MIALDQEYAAWTMSGREVALRFPESEYRDRLAQARARLVAEGLDALLIFAQESHYYLTGFDTAGFVFFQVGVLTANDDKLVLLTRMPDKRQAEVASLYDEIRIWLNAEDADPAAELRDILDELGLKGGKVGVEMDSHGLTVANWQRVATNLNGFATLCDASHVVRRLRLVKTPAERDMMRMAGRLADMAVQAAFDAATPGIFDTAMSGAAVTAQLAAGADMPAGGPLLNVGSRALFGRGMGGPRKLEENDQILIELAGSACRYHVVVEHTAVTGKVDPRQQRQMDVAIDALNRIKEAAVPGERLGTLNDIHYSVLDAGGYAKQRYAACGYALGCTFKPTWMDVPPMIYTGNPLVLEPGMVFFVHIMIPNTETGLVAGVGQTFIIGEEGKGVETLSQLPLQLWKL
ncbi:Xaa-Pro peptidase family protein [Aquamicrobium sp. LC103]|uniref:M24 family metallopeptidase n=1 Tax=Aquamicrobium sp. LC103 TaxID=1120658 RepID=UPI000699C3E5|nr:Xaa-Pro peptidase family protein [Aquamicrobium sp. LC103]TKT69765.1 aminopeptidase P family protein [Aquamicrobium sp. LC103]